MKTSGIITIFLLALTLTVQTYAQPVIPSKSGMTVTKLPPDANRKTSPPSPYMGPSYMKGVREIGKKGLPMQKQEKPYWCWAACLQSLFAQDGDIMTQSEIVTGFFGSPVDAPVKLDDIAIFFNKTKRYKAVRAGRPATKLELLACLQENKKIIAFILKEEPKSKKPGEPMLGHSVLLQAYNTNIDIFVSDPETGLTTKHDITEVYEKWKWVDAVVVDHAN